LETIATWAIQLLSESLIVMKHRKKSNRHAQPFWRPTMTVARHLSPERMFILSFAGVIVTGALLLYLPFSAAQSPIPWVDALFQSASAVCVTGLATVDVGQDLSTAGQVVLICLFQIGGLGILTFSAVFFVILGRGLASKEHDIMQSVFLYAPRRDLASMLKFILLSTFLYEAAGTLLLWARFSQDFPWGEALYKAAFHAISAFNNAGFSLFSDNLVSYQGDWIVNLTFMGLIVAGGIGFIVHYELHLRIFGQQRRLSVHTKTVLVTTGVLIVGGAALFFVFENHRILKDLPWNHRLLASLFQSITPRTAGFNTVDIGMLANETILLMITLMFIGASPGSTGGGVKTTSASLLFLIMWSRLRGREEVNIFNRTIPRELLQRTISIMLAATLSICFVMSILLLTADHSGPPGASRHLFVEYIFETTSAFGTVGLSMNLTPSLNTPQKLAVVLMMFAGRVGPLTLAFSLARMVTKKSFTYAEEGVMVG
jgi:trk system potassium uptake protein TrkH